MAGSERHINNRVALSKAKRLSQHCSLLSMAGMLLLRLKRSEY